MKLENQVCTLEQAKKLKELGIGEFKSLFRWCVFCPNPIGGNHYYEAVYGNGVESALQGKYLADAFTVAELGEYLVMDDDTHFTQGGYNEHLGCWELDLSVRDESAENGFRIIHEARQEAETEAEARADMLIYLLEKNLILAHNLIEG